MYPLSIYGRHKEGCHVYKICFAGQIGLSAHKDMEVHTFFEGIQSFIDFKTLLHKICAGANFRLVMGCFNEVI